MIFSIKKCSDQREGVWYEVTVDDVKKIFTSIVEVQSFLMLKVYELILQNA